MTKYTAEFSTGLVATSKKVQAGPSVHAWLAAGTLKSGRSWQMSGFSSTTAGALQRLAESTRHLPRQGAKITLKEVVPATVVQDRVAA